MDPSHPAVRLSRGKRIRLLVLAVFPFSSVVLGVNGLFVFPFLVGVFFASAYQAVRPFVVDARKDAIAARVVRGLLYAFIPGLLIVGIATALGSEIKLSNVAVDAILLIAVYWTTAAGTAIAAYKIITKRGSDLDRRIAAWLRWPVIVAAAWTVAFLVLEGFFRGPFISVNYQGLVILGSYVVSIVLLVWCPLAVRRTFNPYERPELVGPVVGKAALPAGSTPSFSPFGGSGR